MRGSIHSSAGRYRGTLAYRTDVPRIDEVDVEDQRKDLAIVFHRLLLCLRTTPYLSAFSFPL